MGILLLVIVVLFSLVMAARAWKSYEVELRRGSRAPDTGEVVDAFLFSDAGEAGSSCHPSSSHSPHHVDLSCTDSHHAAGCDIGGHGGFDGGGHH